MERHPVGWKRAERGNDGRALRLRGTIQDVTERRNTEEAFRQKIGPWVVEEIHAQITRSLVLEEANKRLTDEHKKIVEADLKGGAKAKAKAN